MFRCLRVLLLLMIHPGSPATLPMALAEEPIAPAPEGLLREAVDRWAGERELWAFSQHVREYHRERVKEHRVERYDPSQPATRRWTLLALNGREPTAREQSAFRERKGRKRSYRNSPADYIDFARVTVLADTTDLVVFDVPLRDDVSLWVPFEKFAISVAVNKATAAIEEIRVGLHEPFAIAFGLARVSELAFDLHLAAADESAALDPEGVQPEGMARATLSKFGTRVELAWFDFERTTPSASASAVADASRDRRDE